GRPRGRRRPGAAQRRAWLSAVRDARATLAARSTRSRGVRRRARPRRDAVLPCDEGADARRVLHVRGRCRTRAAPRPGPRPFRGVRPARSDRPGVGCVIEPYDAIVVGSGITGGWAAKELCEKGLRTLVLERDGHGVDWPIRYKDLAPWYDYVERFVGVSGERLGLGHLPDGEFLPPWDLTCAERVVQRGIERAFRGRHLTITRVANLTRAHNGRGPCQARNQCARGCSFGGYFSSLSATLPAARNTGRLTLVTDAIVHSVIYDERTDRAAGVRVIDAHTKAAREYFGRLIFLCASTLGTAQILLSSRSARFPTGLANSSGELGHNLMDHISKAGAHGTVPGLEDKYVYG